MTSLTKFDGLTGALTKHWFTREVETALSAGKEGCLIAIEVVGFFGVNYAYGYIVGDALLRALAIRIAASIGERANLSRYRPKTLVAFAPDASEAIASKIAEEVCTAVSDQPFVFSYEGEQQSFSIETRIRTAVTKCTPSSSLESALEALWSRLSQEKENPSARTHAKSPRAGQLDAAREVFVVPSQAQLGWPPVSAELAKHLEALRDYVVATAPGSIEGVSFPSATLSALASFQELPSAFETWLLPLTHRAGRVDFSEGENAAAYALGRHLLAMRTLSRARSHRDMARIAAGVLRATYGGPTGNLVGSPDPSKYCRDTMLLSAQTKLSFACVDALARHGTRAPKIALEALEETQNHRNADLRFAVQQVIRLIKDETASLR